MGLLFLYPAGRRELRPVKRKNKKKKKKEEKMEANSVSPPPLLLLLSLQETGALLIVASLLAMMDSVWLLVFFPRSRFLRLESLRTLHWPLLGRPQFFFDFVDDL
jgi:hypothetical protein